MELSGDRAYDTVSAGLRARVLLGQLAGWAQGHQEAFELEAQMKANAESKAAASKRGTTGFA